MDYEKKYKEALERARQIQNTPYTAHWDVMKEVVEAVFPELKESEDERIRTFLHHTFTAQYLCKDKLGKWHGEPVVNILAWLEKQGEREPCMIQWKGDNLKEVIDFTGKDKNFEKWFKSFEEYEKYVDDHNGIFKLFNADGSHYEIPVGSWIVKTPDGYNVASKAKYKQKPAEWSKEDISKIDRLISYFSRKDNKEFTDWFTLLKDKVQPQTKQEWSEEDETILDNLIWALKEDMVLANDRDEYVNWLKSLKPQNRWKPNDEQMKVLNECLNFAANHESPHWNDYIFGTLNNLIRQLKKLREE